jgi:membrane protease YdiL (CAAX protease family)
MTPVETEPRYPFWSYVDLAMFVAIIVPCVGASLIIGAFLFHAIGIAATWVAQVVLYLLLFGWLTLLLKVRYGRPFWESLAWLYPARGLMACILLGPLLAITVGVLGQLLHTPVIDLPIKKLLQGKLSFALFGLFSVIIGPVTEELAFRGFMMPLLVRSLGPSLGILLTAIPFGLLHGSQYGWLWQYVLLVGVAGACFGWARYLTGSTLASAAMHGTYNLTLFVALAQSGTR